MTLCHCLKVGFFIQAQRIWNKCLYLCKEHLCCNVQETHFLPNVWLSEDHNSSSPALLSQKLSVQVSQRHPWLFQTSMAFWLIFFAFLTNAPLMSELVVSVGVLDSKWCYGRKGLQFSCLNACGFAFLISHYRSINNLWRYAGLLITLVKNRWSSVFPLTRPIHILSLPL